MPATRQPSTIVWMRSSNLTEGRLGTVMTGDGGAGACALASSITGAERAEAIDGSAVAGACDRLTTDLGGDTFAGSDGDRRGRLGHGWGGNGHCGRRRNWGGDDGGRGRGFGRDRLGGFRTVDPKNGANNADDEECDAAAGQQHERLG